MKDYYRFIDMSRALLSVEGGDALSLLQGLVTQDLRTLRPGRMVYTALCSPQGRYVHDFFVICLKENQYILDTHRERFSDLLRRLKMYKLRSQVVLEDLTDQKKVVLYFNPAADDSGEGGQGVSAPSCAEGCEIVQVDPRLPALGFRALYAENFPIAAEGAVTEDPFIYQRFLLRWGVPNVPADMSVEKGIPLECGLDELNAIGWDKGCYLGQELTARTKHRGLVRKRLFPVKVQLKTPLGEGVTPEGQELFLEGQKVGVLRRSLSNGEQHIGLALLRLEAITKLEQNKSLFIENEHCKVDPYTPSWHRWTADFQPSSA